MGIASYLSPIINLKQSFKIYADELRLILDLYIQINLISYLFNDLSFFLKIITADEDSEDEDHESEPPARKIKHSGGFIPTTEATAATETVDDEEDGQVRRIPTKIFKKN